MAFLNDSVLKNDVYLYLKINLLAFTQIISLKKYKIFIFIIYIRTYEYLDGFPFVVGSNNKRSRKYHWI